MLLFIIPLICLQILNYGVIRLLTNATFWCVFLIIFCIYGIYYVLKISSKISKKEELLKKQMQKEEFPTKDKYEEQISAIQTILNKRTEIHKPELLKKVEIGAIYFIVGLGYILYFLFLLKVIDVIINGLSAPTLMLHYLKYAFPLSVLAYSAFVLCIILERNRLISIYKQYPYACICIWKWNHRDCEDIPSLAEFHDKNRNENKYIDIALAPCTYNKTDLKILNDAIKDINDNLSIICSEYPEDVLRFLVSTCKVRANNQATYSVTRTRDTNIKKLLSLKDIVIKSLTSKFAKESVFDILNKDFCRFGIHKEDYNDVNLNKKEVFSLFDVKTRPTLSSGYTQLGCILLLFVLYICAGASYARYKYLESEFEQIINARKTSDAIMAKFDILEKHIADSLEYESKTTIPIVVRIQYNPYEYTPHIGGVRSVGKVIYDHKEYINNDTIFYTYGTDITFQSYSEEDDNIPAKNRRNETRSFSKEELSNLCTVYHNLKITENRGQYSGEWTTTNFNYTLSVVGIEFPGDEKIKNNVLAEYHTSHSNIEINDSIKQYFFSTPPAYSIKNDITTRITDYKCIKSYQIDLSKEINEINNYLKSTCN